MYRYRHHSHLYHMRLIDHHKSQSYSISNNFPVFLTYGRFKLDIGKTKFSWTANSSLAFVWQECNSHELESIHGILLSPCSCCLLITRPLALVNMSNFRNKRIIRIGVSQERANWQKHLRDCQCRTPLFLEDIQTDATIGVDVWMINLGLEVNLWRLEGVIWRKVDHNKENSSGIRAVSWTHYGCLPMK